MSKKLVRLAIAILSSVIVIFTFTGGVLSQTGSATIESDAVAQTGAWTSQAAADASGGSYLYSSGATTDALTLEFTGNSVDIVYVKNPNLGTFAIEIDNVVVRTVITTSQQTEFGVVAAVDYLEPEQNHTVRIYAVEGVIAIDAFVTNPRPVENVAEPIVDLPATAAVYTVNSTSNSGGPAEIAACASSQAGCTLRAAIELANSSAFADTINFNIPGTGPHAIFVTGSPLPTITEPVLINGASEPGSTASNLLIELDGQGVTNDGLTIDADLVTIRGLSIVDFADDGIQINGDQNLIVGNWIGVTAASASPVEANGTGIQINGDFNTIGEAAPGGRNVISGNTNDGILIPTSGQNNAVFNNYIGTSPVGGASSDYRNGDDGIQVSGDDNTIGSIVSDHGNRIWNNSDDGVYV